MAGNRINVILGLDTSGFMRSINQVERSLGKMSQTLQNAGASLTQSLTLPLGAVAAASLKSFAELEKLNKGLVAIMGSTEMAADELARLREVARLPGLGLKEAVQGSINLQAVGLSADEARNTLLGFGKALAATGKGKVELEAIQYQLTQMISKNKLLAEDYKVIQSNLPLMAKGMEAAFGTNNIENIRATGIGAKEFTLRLSEALAKLPQTQNVTGGLANAFENFGDSLFIVGAQMGEAINKAFGLEDILGKLANAVQRAADWFTSLSPGMQKAIVYTAALAAALGPLLFVIGKMTAILPGIIAGVKALGVAFTFITGPIGLTVLAIGAIIAAVAYAYTKFEGFRRVVNGIGSSFMEFVSILKEGGAAFVRAFGELKEGEFKKAAKSIEEGLRKTNPVSIGIMEGKRLRDAFNDGFKDDTNYLKNVQAEFKKAVSGGVGVSVPSQFERAAGADDGKKKRKPFEIEPIGKLNSFNPQETIEAFAAVKGLDASLMGLKITMGEIDPDKIKFDGAIASAKLFGDSMQAVYERTKAGLKPVQSSIKTFTQQLYDAFENTLTYIESNVMPAFNSLNAVFSQGFANRQAAIDSYYDTERSRIEGSMLSEQQKASAMEQLDKEVATRRKKLAREQAIRDKLVGIVSAVINTAQGVTKALASANIPLAAIIGGLGAVQVGLIAGQKIPALARGGVTTGETLAVVGDNPSGREAIIPFERMGEFLDMAGGGAMKLTGLFEVRGQDLLLVIDRANQEKIRVR